MVHDDDDPYNAPPRPVKVLSRPYTSPRGVVEAAHAPDGYRQLSVVTRDGELLASLLIAQRLADRPGFVANLHKLLDREGPSVQLSLIS